jgi:hypothetical protein
MSAPAFSSNTSKGKGVVVYRYHGRFVSALRARQLSRLGGPSRYVISEIKIGQRKLRARGYVTEEQFARSQAARRGWEARRKRAERERERERLEREYERERERWEREYERAAIAAWRKGEIIPPDEQEFLMQEGLNMVDLQDERDVYERAR